MRSTIAVIAKAPVPGQVKTRLCPPCRPEEAAALAEAALTDTLAAASVVTDARLVVALDGPPGPWLRGHVEVVPQRGADLGRRLAHLFVDLARTSPGPTLVVAMDTPQITGLHFMAGLEALDAHDVSLGPTDDGGYWGIGLARPHPALFDGVPMSAPGTGRAQLARAEQLGLRTFVLPQLRDVDTIEDVRAVASRSPCTRFAVTAHRLGLIGTVRVPRRDRGESADQAVRVDPGGR